MGKHGLRMGCFVAVVLFFVGCTQEFDAVRIQEYERNRLASSASTEAAGHRQILANEVVLDIRYIKDSRTSLCFAYRWGGDLHGGPSLATVPCEAIPAHLLTVAW